MTKRRDYLSNDPAIRHAVAVVAMAIRRCEEALTAASAHQLTEPERADLTDAHARLTRLIGQP